MSDAEKTTVDAVESVDAENVASNVNEVDKVKQLTDLVEHYKSQLDIQTKESKKAFEKRDEVKKKLRELESSNKTSEEIENAMSLLQEKLSEKEKEMELWKEDQLKEKKMKMVKERAMKLGFKEKYINELNNFVDLGKIIDEKEFTADYEIESLKTRFPDFFSDMNLDIPTPDLGNNVDFETRKREAYLKALRNNDFETAMAIQEDYLKKHGKKLNRR